MKFTTDAKTIKKAIKKAAMVIDTQEARLNDLIKLEAAEGKLEMQAFSALQNIKTAISCDTEAAGTVTVSAKMLSLITSKLDSEKITFAEDGNHLVIESDDSQLKLLKAESQKMAEIRKEQGAVMITAEADKLAKALEAALPFCDEQPNSRTLGIKLQFKEDKIKTTAGTSFCLIMAEETQKNKAESKDIVLSKKTAETLAELCKDAEEDIVLQLGEKSISFENADTGYASAILDTKFPDTEKIFAQRRENAKEIDKAKLMKALDRISCFKGKNNYVAIHMKDNTMTIKISNNELGNAVETISTEGDTEEKNLGANFEHISKAARKARSEKIKLYANRPLEPFFLSTGNAVFVMSQIRASRSDS